MVAKVIGETLPVSVEILALFRTGPRRATSAITAVTLPQAKACRFSARVHIKVLYKLKGLYDLEIKGILYSSKPLILEIK